MIRTFRIYSLIHFQIYHTALLTIVIIYYIPSTYWKFYHLTTFTQSFNAPPPLLPRPPPSTLPLQTTISLGVALLVREFFKMYSMCCNPLYSFFSFLFLKLSYFWPRCVPKLAPVSFWQDPSLAASFLSGKDALESCPLLPALSIRCSRLSLYTSLDLPRHSFLLSAVEDPQRKPNQW